MLPAGVSMRMLACPVPVIRTWLPLPSGALTGRMYPYAWHPGRRATLIARISTRVGRDVYVSDEEPVTSPDQHKPTPVRAAYIAGLVVAAIMLLMLLGNHKGHVEDIWLIGIA